MKKIIIIMFAAMVVTFAASFTGHLRVEDRMFTELAPVELSTMMDRIQDANTRLMFPQELAAHFPECLTVQNGIKTVSLLCRIQVKGADLIPVKRNWNGTIRSWQSYFHVYIGTDDTGPTNPFVTMVGVDGWSFENALTKPVLESVDPGSLTLTSCVYQWRIYVRRVGNYDPMFFSFIRFDQPEDGGIHAGQLMFDVQNDKVQVEKTLKIIEDPTIDHTDRFSACDKTPPKGDK